MKDKFFRDELILALLMTIAITLFIIAIELKK